MKYIGLILLTACGVNQETYRITDGAKGADGTSCSVSEVTQGALISCTDGTSQLVKNGQNGSTGAQGLPGSNGSDGTNGSDGINGTSGIDGTNGTNGTSCTVSTVSAGVVAPNGGSLITCGDTTSLLLNGTNGVDGQNGTDGQNGQDAVLPSLSLVSVVDPCGNQGTNDEVLLKLANNSLVAVFMDNHGGLNTRLSLLSAGSYETTDGTSCHFIVDNNGNISGEHN